MSQELFFAVTAWFFISFCLGVYEHLPDLRHTFATNALAHGMDIKTLSTILGHVSSATTLNTYSHVADEMRQRAAVKIDQGIAKAEVREDIAITQPERTMTTFQARRRWSREAS